MMKLLKNKKGEAEGFKMMMFGFILLTLFIFLILTFTTNVAQNNGADTTQLEEGAFSLDPYETFLDDVEDTANEFRTDRFANQNIFVTLGDLVISGFFGLLIDMVVFITTPFTLLAQIMTNVLGVPLIVTSVILGLIMLSIIFGIWRLIKIGD